MMGLTVAKLNQKEKVPNGSDAVIALAARKRHNATITETLPVARVPDQDLATSFC